MQEIAGESIPPDGKGRAAENPVNVGATITPDVRRILESNSGVQDLVELALSKLPAYIPSSFEASMHRFVDPYDGTTALVMKLKALSPYGETSRAIDRFCDEFWWQYMDTSPVALIFQAES
jgi:hypothetical protein